MTENPNNEEFNTKLKEVFNDKDKRSDWFEKLADGLKNLLDNDDATLTNAAKMLDKVTREI